MNQSKIDILQLAVLNNIIWCETVGKTHCISSNSNENVWGLQSPAPMFYPDIITSSKNVTTNHVVNFIGNREIKSIKDSFSNVDLAPYGFHVLFDAEWIYHPPIAPKRDYPSTWYIVKTKEDLHKWTAAHGTENSIRPELLEQEDVKIYMFEEKGLISGFITNVQSNVVGVSNVFSQHNFQHLWYTITNIVSYDFPSLIMVGYESGEDLTSALSSGWTSIGPLRVWLKS